MLKLRSSAMSEESSNLLRVEEDETENRFPEKAAGIGVLGEKERVEEDRFAVGDRVRVRLEVEHPQGGRESASHDVGGKTGKGKVPLASTDGGDSGSQMVQCECENAYFHTSVAH